MYSGRCEKAVALLRQAKTQVPPEAEEGVAIRGALASTYLFLGRTDEIVAATEELAVHEPQTPEDYLFKAIALVYVDNKESSRLIDEYFRLRNDSAVGRMVRATARSVAAAKAAKLDSDVAEKAVYDAKIASERMPESAAADMTRMIAHGTAGGIHLKLENDPQAEAHKQQATAIADKLRMRTSGVFPTAHAEAAKHFEAVGQQEKSRELWQLAYESGLSGYQLAGYAQFEHRHGDEDRARKVLQEDDRLCSWSRYIRSVLAWIPIGIVDLKIPVENYAESRQFMKK
jgi:hypothetical protein